MTWLGHLECELHRRMLSDFGLISTNDFLTLCNTKLCTGAAEWSQADTSDLNTHGGSKISQKKFKMLRGSTKKTQSRTMLIEMVWGIVHTTLGNPITSFAELISVSSMFGPFRTCHTTVWRGGSTAVTSTEWMAFIAEVIITVNIVVISAIIIFHTVAASPLMADWFHPLSLLRRSPFTFPFLGLSFFPLLMHPSIILSRSLASAALSAAPHSLAGLWNSARGRTREGENPTDSVRCVNHNKINFKLRTAATVLQCFNKKRKTLCQDYLSKHVFFWEYRIK